MERSLFDEPTARAKGGAKVRTRVEFSGVARGTLGKVARADPSGKGYTLGIEWDLPGRSKPLVDWFTRSEYEESLEELSHVS